MKYLINLVRNIVISKLHRCLIEERGLVVVTYEVGFSSNHICGLIVESCSHGLVKTFTTVHVEVRAVSFIMSCLIRSLGL